MYQKYVVLSKCNDTQPYPQAQKPLLESNMTDSNDDWESCKKYKELLED